LCFGVACSDDRAGQTAADIVPVTDVTATDASASDTKGQPAAARAFYFVADASQNAWTVAVVDPGASPPSLTNFHIDALSALSGPTGTQKGPAWQDGVLSSDGKRLFVNTGNGTHKVAVLRTQPPGLEVLLDVGKGPVHIYNPNHGKEIWTHADDEGAFYVIDQTSLAVGKPLVAALNNKGHGKLVYAPELGSTYFATNVADPGAFAIDGDAKTAPVFLPLCGTPCKDDPATLGDESTATCGGTHEKAYNPVKDWVVFQCSGATAGKYAFVQGKTKQVVKDLVTMSGGTAFTPDNAYILVIDGAKGTVGIWDTAKPGHDGIAFDATLTIDKTPSQRGTALYQNAQGHWEAWIPQSAGTQLVIVDLVTQAKSTVEIGPLSPPAGATSATRRGAIAGSWYATHNDAGMVLVDLASRQVAQVPWSKGVVQRIIGWSQAKP
jgi:hypothetical protein